MLNRFEKYPCSEISFGINWSKLYADDAILTSEWEIPEGITGGEEVVSGSVTTVLLGGGTVGETYTLKNTINLSSGQVDCEFIQIKIIA